MGHEHVGTHLLAQQEAMDTHQPGRRQRRFLGRIGGAAGWQQACSWNLGGTWGECRALGTQHRTCHIQHRQLPGKPTCPCSKTSAAFSSRMYCHTARSLLRCTPSPASSAAWLTFTAPASIGSSASSLRPYCPRRLLTRCMLPPASPVNDIASHRHGQLPVLPLLQQPYCLSLTPILPVLPAVLFRCMPSLVSCLTDLYRPCFSTMAVRTVPPNGSVLN